MSLNVTLSATESVTVTPAEVVDLSGTVSINRIIDLPKQRKVIAVVEGLGRITLDELSGDNYDTPSEWSNADVVTAVTNYIQSN